MRKGARGLDVERRARASPRRRWTNDVIYRRWRARAGGRRDTVFAGALRAGANEPGTRETKAGSNALLVMWLGHKDLADRVVSCGMNPKIHRVVSCGHTLTDDLVHRIGTARKWQGTTVVSCGQITLTVDLVHCTVRTGTSINAPPSVRSSSLFKICFQI